MLFHKNICISLQLWLAINSDAASQRDAVSFYNNLQPVVFIQRLQHTELILVKL